MRAKLLLRSTACIIQTNVPPASPRPGMLRNLYRLLVQSSAYAIYHHWARARVINYCCVRAPTCSQHRRVRPPDHPKRKNEENPSRTARARHPVTVIL
jgi:hypothetical protein